MGYFEENGIKYHDEYFTKNEIIEKFEVFEGEKTLKEVDVRDVFHSQEPAKGIVGCVVEQSVLGMKQNSKQEADLQILQSDGEYRRTELKSTGVVPSNKEGQKYEAKEPASLTAVSIGTIEHETFDNSHFKDKLEHLLFVFYLYDRNKVLEDGSIEYQKVVPYKEYDRFKVLGYKFFDLLEDEDELAKFKNDWLKTQEYLINANKTEDPEALYPMLHSSIKDNLFYCDIAPRYKKKTDKEAGQTPRFRLKKTYVNTIFQDAYNEMKGKAKLERLPLTINSYEELNAKLHELTLTYKGKTVEELVKHFGIKTQYLSKTKKEDRDIIPKQVTETIAVNMLGGESRKISNIDLFEKIGVIGKSIVVTQTQKRTEDTKFFTLDLEELNDEQIEFEDSSFYQYFSEHKILCIIYEEPSTEAPLNDNKFLGFKWFTFSDDFIYNTIKPVYEIIRDRIMNHTLVENYVYKKDGTMRINNTGVPMVELNFPKSSESNIFVRGTSSDSTHKPWTFEGQAADGTSTIHSYTQQVWIKGSYIVNELNNIDFI